MQTEHYMANMDRPARGTGRADDEAVPDRAPAPATHVDTSASGRPSQAPRSGGPVTRRS